MTTPPAEPSPSTVRRHALEDSHALDVPSLTALHAPTFDAPTSTQRTETATLSAQFLVGAGPHRQVPVTHTLPPLVLTGHTAGLQCESCGGTRIVLMPNEGQWRKWMASGASGSGRRNTLILQRMRYLFENYTSPETGEPLTGKEISQRAAELGYNLSTSYVLSLRNGSRTHPSLESLEALAAVFGLEINYFFTGDEPSKTPNLSATDTALAAAMRNGSVRDIALSAAKMTPETQRTLARIARELSSLDITKHGGTPDEK